MVEHTWLFISLAIVATISCLWLLKRLLTKRASKEFILLFGNLAVMNIFQTLGYAAWHLSPRLGELSADLYLVSAYFFFTHLLIFSFGLSKSPLTGKKFAALYIYPVLLTLLHASGLTIESYRIEQNTLMHNDGLLAPLFDIYVLFCCVGSATVFARNIKAHRGTKYSAPKTLSAYFPSCR